MEALAALFKRHGRVVRIPADEAIFSRGSEVPQIYQLSSGSVFLHSSSFAGREIGFEIVKPGEVLEVVSALQTGRANVDATALTDCELLALDRDLFVTAVEGDANVTREVLGFVAGQLARRTRQAEELALYTVRGRLARYVMALAQQQQGEPISLKPIRLVFRQKIMAAMAGISRETLNRQFRIWAEAGIVAIEGRELRVLKPDALGAFAGLSYD